ncbi:hypothetical protein [Brevundimonas lenta]|uniref:Transporter n=1 Tax=Brevundimonas lenta TaxID=424796 RepID=A0A7W6NPS1_9CAUL|nr:hypothetical protein [Brevundimonas lenta]MBB4082834.1 hypothetical protein [Brevundimonas lenta]
MASPVSHPRSTRQTGGGWRLAGVAVAAAVIAAPFAAQAQEPETGEHPPGSDADLAAKLSNPVSSMISVPIQWNYDCCIGPNDGARMTVNVQPVIPVPLNDDWNLVVRTILPIVYQQSTAPGVPRTTGISDITQSFFFTPSHTRNGVTWAVGPVFLWPVGTEELGTQKWGAGPTGLLLKQDGGSTYGVLANHIWSYAGDDDRGDVSQTFLQPFFSYTTRGATTYGLNSEATYNWETRTWSVPINATISQLYKFGQQRVQVGAGARFYLTDEVGAPTWGLRANATFLFPQ